MKTIKQKPTPKESNPFVNEHFKVRVRVLTDNKNLKNVGTVLSPILVPTETILEGEAHTKLFRDMDVCNAILQLSPAGIKLWTWIQYHIERNVCFIAINNKLFTKRSGLSYKSYGRAIKELKECEFICNSSISGTYFIDPALIFFGNRAEVFKDHIQR